MDGWFGWACITVMVSVFFSVAYLVGTESRFREQQKYEQCLQAEGSYIQGTCILGRK